MKHASFRNCLSRLFHFLANVCCIVCRKKASCHVCLKSNPKSRETQVGVSQPDTNNLNKED